MTKTEVEDFQALEHAIFAEARDEAGQMKADAAERANAIRKRAHEQAKLEKKAILDRANQDAERLRGQVVATARLKARSLELENREKVLNRVFGEARKRLALVAKRPDYDSIVAMLLREALTQLKVNQAQIRADEATRKSLEKGALDEISREFNGEYTLGSVLNEGTGIIVDAKDGKLHYDNTLETRLDRMQSTLRSSVYKILMGEKE